MKIPKKKSKKPRSSKPGAAEMAKFLDSIRLEETEWIGTVKTSGNWHEPDGKP